MVCLVFLQKKTNKNKQKCIPTIWIQKKSHVLQKKKKSFYSKRFLPIFTACSGKGSFLDRRPKMPRLKGNNRKKKHTQKSNIIILLCYIYTTWHTHTRDLVDSASGICLFQGLSHACLRITALQESAHGSLHQTQSAANTLRFPQYWITSAKCEANTWIKGVVTIHSVHSLRGVYGSVAPCEWMKLKPSPFTRETNQ